MRNVEGHNHVRASSSVGEQTLNLNVVVYSRQRQLMVVCDGISRRNYRYGASIIHTELVLCERTIRSR